MVFGHNTNIKIGNITFHVQTEDRGEPHALLDTTVYFQGRVLHRRTNNYFDLLPLNEDREQALKLRLDEQHHSVLDEMKSGRLQLAIPKAPEVVNSTPASETLVHQETDTAHPEPETAHSEPTAAAEALPVAADEPHIAAEHLDRPVPVEEVPPAPEIADAPPPAPVVAVDRKLHVVLENAKNWLAGKRAHLQVVVLAEDDGAVAGANVVVKIAGSALEEIFHGTTNEFGKTEIAFEMPKLAKPDVALEIQAEHLGAQGSLRYAMRAKPKVPAV